MDLTATSGGAAATTPLPAGIDHAALELDGPAAHGDRMGTPAPDEQVLWKGRPALGLFARSAFHTRTLGLYFAALIAIALVSGNTDAAMVAAVLGTALIGLLHLLAWVSTRSTLYILTDTRLIMRIGMAIETRINLPLKQITAAHFRPRGNGHGDIALELGGERLLGVALLWPHMRPWHYNRPQPMLRCVPDAGRLAQLIAEARAQFGAVERNLSDVSDAVPAIGQQGAQPTASPGRAILTPHRGERGLSEPGFKGAPA